MRHQPQAASPHRGSEEVHGDGIVLAAGQSGARGTAALTGQKADSKRRRAYRHLGSPATHRFKEVHMLPLISGQSLFLFSGQIHPIPGMERDPAPLNDALPDSPMRVLSDH